MSVETAAAVTASSAVSVISDVAAGAGSQAATGWLSAHPEYTVVAAIVLALLAGGIEWLRKRAKRTDTQVDDVLLDTTAKAVEQTREDLAKKDQ